MNDHIILISIVIITFVIPILAIILSNIGESYCSSLKNNKGFSVTIKSKRFSRFHIVKIRYNDHLPWITVKRCTLTRRPLLKYKMKTMLIKKSAISETFRLFESIEKYEAFVKKQESLLLFKNKRLKRLRERLNNSITDIEKSNNA